MYSYSHFTWRRDDDCDVCVFFDSQKLIENKKKSPFNTGCGSRCGPAVRCAEMNTPFVTQVVLISQRHPFIRWGDVRSPLTVCWTSDGDFFSVVRLFIILPFEIVRGKERNEYICTEFPAQAISGLVSSSENGLQNKWNLFARSLTAKSMLSFFGTTLYVFACIRSSFAVSAFKINNFEWAFFFVLNTVYIIQLFCL